ncbi:MAG: TVP38/TMEM64 family protein [Clostridia bacterium]|nr:TVP38/TMEM64 family protein [Clostridia bacterium]
MELSRKQKVLRTILVVVIVGLILCSTYFVFKITGVWERVNSVQKLQTLILELGFWGRSAFVLLQFLQVTFIPIPSPILVVAGTLIYGPFEAGLLSLAGILLGSAVAFFIGRIFGKKLVVYMVGKNTEQKWRKFLSGCKYTFVLMMLLPLFPDDILCLVAGVTDMSSTFFMVTQLISRPIGIFALSYFSSGQIIPYHGWGLIVWGIIAIFSLVAIYLTSKYNQKIENFIKNLFKKQKKGV